MSLRLSKTPRAKLDIIDIAEFLAEESPPASERFIESIHSILRFLLENQRIGRLWRAERNWRVFPVSNFPDYLVFYEILEGRLRVLTILHGARDIPSLVEEL